ncbi:MAG: hypothetical protein KF766_08135 [Rhodocyclaceae bacterium]|nr:hypothetical protein [Rhodocyclaceae bacterium]
MTKRFLAEHGVNASVGFLGRHQLKPPILADAIVDVSETSPLSARQPAARGTWCWKARRASSPTAPPRKDVWKRAKIERTC